MRPLMLWGVCLTIGAASAGLLSADEKDDGFKPIFDGKALENWDGNPKFWKVEDGAIVGETTKENPTKGNTFIIWRGGEPGDFELKLQYRITGGNSGVQYRSFEVPNQKWVVGGYQADIDSGDTYSGILYGERFRGILCPRGKKTVINDDGKPEVVGELGDSKELQSKVKKEDWNDYHVVARGFRFVHKINGVTMAECTDEDGDTRREKGIIALQLHAGPPMKVEFRNVRLKELTSGNKERDQTEQKATKETKGKRPGKANARKADTKQIVFIAGRPSHGYGAHEHKAGCMLLAEALNESGLPVKAEVVTGGWPKDTGALEHADAIVIYADGGGGHPFNAHLDEIDRLMKKGIGLVCIHYAVEVPKGKPGEKFLDWTGGYFETHWSVNPHWTAEYKKLPRHPIARGVKPFSINDEWYYHMRFREELDGVTPILTDLPPDSTLRRPDGAHSGNKFVRAAVAEGQPQHMAWARERPDGGRGFGFTGGHIHWNWGHNEFRKLVLNAIVWSARVEVPEEGVPSKPLTVADLEANQDYPQPGNFNRARIQALLEQWNGSQSGKASAR